MTPSLAPRFLASIGAALALLCSLPLPVSAYNPPSDSAGPLAVRIEGPAEVTQLDTSLPVRVVLENRSDQRISGTLELKVIDRWRAEPAQPVAFAVEGKRTASHDFKVVAGQGTYSAHYPIHAFARFEAAGQKLVAHPILVLETRLPHAPRPQQPVAWKPVRMAKDGELALWRVAAVRAVVAVFKEQPQTMPAGWQGSEPRTGGTMHVERFTLAGQGRDVVRIHPPWQKGLAGTLLAEYPIQLPKTTPIKLSFANAMTPDGQSDGVTFRVRVVPLDAPAGEFGRVVFERHTAAKTWQEGQADLSEFAGQAVRIQLESHPGPKNNTGWDSCFWAEPVLSAGAPPAPPAFPPKETTGSRALGAVGRQKKFTVRVWPGRRGLLDAAVGFADGDRVLAFRGFEVRVLGGRIDDARSPLLLQGVKEEPAEGYQVRHRFHGDAGPFDVVGRLFVERGVLRAQFRLENGPAPKPWLHVRLEDVATGPWSQSARHVYAGEGNVIRDPGPFRLGFDGHQLATSFVGFDFETASIVQGVDVPPDHLEVAPDRRHYSLHAPHAQTMTFIADANVWEGVKGWRDTNGLAAAGGVEKAAGRFVFDLWGGRYADLAAKLRRSFRYGLGDSLVIVHNWQRWGYDYRLPDIYPPNPAYGTLAEVQDLVRACKDVGAPIALHDNYIDLYPDAEGFSFDENIAFHADGTPVRAWLNEHRKAQSYRFRADRVAPFLQRNLKLIRQHMGPTAYFIDVWSSIGPYDYWTADGKFFDRVFTRTSWGEHFAWIRDHLGDRAPQISESGHDQLVGWLDGSQTNHLRVGKPGSKNRYGSWCVWDIPHGDAERTPWFDAAHHDRFVQHGAGYPSRYEGGLDPKLHGIYSDDYMCTEVLTGHPAMVPEAFGRQVVRKYWLLHDLMRALALRRIEGVEYVGGNLHRQRVRWSGGAETWVNRGAGDWSVDGVVLPQYGFLARVPTEKGLVEAMIVRRDGVIVETARSPEQIYVNGRGVVSDTLPIRVSVEKVRHTGGRGLEVSLRWQADAPIPAGWVPFVHFCDEEGEIVFQAGHRPARFDTEQKGEFAGVAATSIPEGLASGQACELRVGIYHPKTGVRAPLSGPDDGGRRIRLGKIRLEGQGKDLTGVAWTAHAPEPDPVLARQNPKAKPIDFGAAVAAGGFRLTADGQRLVITPLPEARTESEIRIRWAQLPWRLPEPAHVEAIAEDGRVLSRQPVRREGQAVVVTASPEAFALRVGQ